MIITRTPVRVSFFGGGTDYPAWFREHGGAVLSTTINKYCYITLRKLPPFFDHNYRLAYSKLEFVKEVAEIEHPCVRACLQYLGVEGGIGLHHDADLPARTGLGSSSAFTVGLLKAIHALQGRMVSAATLATQAIDIEQNVLRENVGCQDQAAAAYGGFNLITIGRQGQLRVSPMTLKPERINLLNDHLMLLYTGVSRIASDIAASQIRHIQTKSRDNELSNMRLMVDRAVDILGSDDDITAFGEMLHESWCIKRRMADQVSTTFIDQLYDEARMHGAIGGKLLGAGGGGFFLIFARPEDHAAIREALARFLFVPFRFEPSGSEIIHFDHAV
jgi:D-glycero-alpha-D-manno-heptose-7-phosphate kinase